MNQPIEPIVIPHSKEAEAGLLGAVLIYPGVLDEVALEPSAFYIHRHRWIWEAYQRLYSQGLAIDYVSVTTELDRQHQLEEIGAGYLIQLMEQTPNAYHADGYAEIIRDRAKQRTYYELARTLAQQSLNGGVDEAAAIAILTQHSQGEREGRHISQGLDELETFILERKANPQKVWGIPTGFVDLDRRTAGLHKQRVFILSGESGTGKTTLELQWCLHAALSGYGVLIFEKEMPEQPTLMRLVELHSGVPYRAMMSGYISDTQLETFQASKRLLSRKHLHINDDPGLTSAAMRGIISRTKTRQPVDLVMLDYLGLLSDTPEYGKNDYDQTAAKRFREVCREQEVAGITIQDMVKFEGTPSLQNMSGGSKVRFGADEVYFIVKDSQGTSLHYLIPAKERYGDLQKEFVTLNRIGLGFQNYAKEIS